MSNPLSKFLKIPLQIEEETFNIIAKKLGKKDIKPYKAFIKKEEANHKDLDEASKKLNIARDELEELVEEIEDVSIEIDSISDDGERVQLAKERRKLRAELRDKRKEVNTLSEEIETYSDSVQKIMLKSERFLFELKIVEDAERKRLMEYIEANDWGYGTILAEVNKLQQKVAEKK